LDIAPELFMTLLQISNWSTANNVLSTDAGVDAVFQQVKVTHPDTEANFTPPPRDPRQVIQPKTKGHRQLNHHNLRESGNVFCLSCVRTKTDRSMLTASIVLIQNGKRQHDNLIHHRIHSLPFSTWLIPPWKLLYPTSRRKEWPIRRLGPATPPDTNQPRSWVDIPYTGVYYPIV
jgi:hypothetical protein